jgi:hypothetical protein
MTTLREAAQQALEALEMLAQPTKTNSETPRYKAHKAAITALRDALEQQEVPKGGGNLPPPLQAEPVEEPVAWMSPASESMIGKTDENYHIITTSKKTANNSIPLYTHPPRREWKSLTEEEIDCWTPEIHPVIFAIEQALKEKNA